jgi:hypothetical protein
MMGTTKRAFLAELAEPSSSPTVTRGYVEFEMCRLLWAGRLVNDRASLISATGELSPVLVKGVGSLHPGTSPVQFLVRIQGVTLEQAQRARYLMQCPERSH